MPKQPAPPRVPLTPAIARHIARTLRAAIPVPPNATELEKQALQDAAVDALVAMHPGDPLEAMLACQAIAARHAEVDCYRRAKSPGVSPAMADRLCRTAASLSRSAALALRDLEAMQAARPKAPKPTTSATPGVQAQAAAPDQAAAPAAAPVRHLRLVASSPDNDATGAPPHPEHGYLH